MEKETRVKVEEVSMAKEEDDKFGGLGEDDTDRKKKGVGSGSVKKASGGGSVMRCCQAEKCAADLNEAKQYHRRHKVCEHHSKAPIVVVAGIRQRFCQQCSKFHEMSEFDESKRSCRKRLAGHNERRRKNPTEGSWEGTSRRATGVGGEAKEMIRGQVGGGGRIQIAMQDKHQQFR